MTQTDNVALFTEWPLDSNFKVGIIRQINIAALAKVVSMAGACVPLEARLVNFWID